MTEEKRGRRNTRKILWFTLAAVLAVLAAVILPPLISVSRYKSQITHLISKSLGRPVRLSSVEVRLLPRPGFVLTDLTVDEDAAYGAEPVLHANEVVASIRLLSLWRGRLEIGRIGVDEASVNLVRTESGHWNVEPLFRTAAGQNGAGAQGPLKLPYLEATNSRINLKIGNEKLPFSLLDTDLSFWQDAPGEWRIRLRGQPARTDLSLEAADTGMVRLEGSVHRAAELREMPLHLDVEWREAQLGQLTRLILGSDTGWRGNLTGELHLDGTAEAAQIKARLRAEGVHRAEFAPAVPLDFDANCGFVYHFFNRALDNLVCESPLGNGRIRITGQKQAIAAAAPGTAPQDPRSRLTVEMDRVPVQAGLDALRTVRSGFGPGLEAAGVMSGNVTYAPAAAEFAAPETTAKLRSHPKSAPAPPGPLTGGFTIDGFQLRGDGLSTPIVVPHVSLAAVAAPQGQPQALAATVAIPAGGSSPLTITARLATSGYQVTARGAAAVARARELAHVAGLASASALEAVSGDPLSIDLAAEGPWLPQPGVLPANLPVSGATTASAPQLASSDRLTGTLTLHKATWKADYLASPVEIAQATLHLGNGEVRWDPIEFAYGPVKGTAMFALPAPCSPQPCPVQVVPTFNVQFGELHADTLQSAFLGAHKPGTLLSTLIARVRPSSAPAWPQFQGTVRASSLVLGPVTLLNATAALHTVGDGVEFTGFDAGLLGGTIHGAGALHIAGGDQGKPTYSMNGEFEKLNPSAVGQLLGMRWSGGTFDGQGHIDLAGFTGHDLAASAKGNLHFEWRRGAMSGAASPALSRFDRWTASLDIANGVVMLKDNQVQQGDRSRALEGTVTLTQPPKAVLNAPRETRAKR